MKRYLIRFGKSEEEFEAKNWKEAEKKALELITIEEFEE